MIIEWTDVNEVEKKNKGSKMYSTLHKYILREKVSPMILRKIEYQGKE